MPSDRYLVDDVVDRVLHVLTGEAGPDEALDREVRWSLQAAEVTLVNEVNPHAFREQKSITTVTDQSTYDLEDDFHAIIEDTVKFQDTDYRTLKELPVQLFNRLWISQAAATGDPEFYHIVKKDKSSGSWRIFFSPTPDTDTRVVLYSYRSLPEAVWNSARGSGQTMDLRFPPEFIPLLVNGTIAVGHFSRYLNATDLASHMKAWQEGILTFKRNNNPVVGKTYQRMAYPGRPTSIPGGVWPAWWGGHIDGPIN